MAIGRNYTEALQKALQSLDKKGTRFYWSGEIPDAEETKRLLEDIKTPTETRMVQIQQAIRGGATLEEIVEASKIDPWFIDQMFILQEIAQTLKDAPSLTHDLLFEAKQHGFSDLQIAEIRNLHEDTVRELRVALDVVPVYKTVDTCAGKFESKTPYHYSSYEFETEVAPREKEAVIILGSGPNRIGQGIEFDYSCVHATMELGKKYDTIMVNCNPETVSTDYDISSRLYFEPLTFEHVFEIYRAELKAGPIKGMVVQLGGQTPLSLASRLEKAGIPIIGTSPSAIEAAEDRELFGRVLDQAGLNSPAHETALDADHAIVSARKVGYPILVRPSFVLGGRGMAILYEEADLEKYLEESGISAQGAGQGPLLIDKFLSDAIEIDVDALYDGSELFIGGIMEHIEEAGIHSGDSSCITPPVSFSEAIVKRVRKATLSIAQGVNVCGLINIQFALASDVLYVIEANPRASRTVPFISKATGVSLAKAAARIMAGETIQDLKAEGLLPENDEIILDGSQPCSVKEVVFPFNRFLDKQGKFVDTVLGPEMHSTGEVMGLATNFPKAFLKSQLAALGEVPRKGRAFISVADRDKRQVALLTSILQKKGFEILATGGTASVLRRSGLDVTTVRKVSDGTGPHGEPTIADMIRNGEVDLVLNTPNSRGARADGYEIRTATTAASKPIITTMQQFSAFVLSLDEEAKDLEVMSLQDYEKIR